MGYKSEYTTLDDRLFLRSLTITCLEMLQLASKCLTSGNRLLNSSVSNHFAIELQGITRSFPGVVANRSVSLKVVTGTFHALIGENGAGKSTLLNILFGRLKPDEGSILFNGNDVTNELNSPLDAIRKGIGLVSQHFSLIPALSILENLMLSQLSGSILLDKASARAKALPLMERLGIGHLNLNQKTSSLSVTIQQRVEILKALFQGATTLLLDEPTATLAPTEVEALFQLLKELQKDGATILFVTHKLREMLSYSDHISVLRHGENAGDYETAFVTSETLIESMMGSGKNYYKPEKNSFNTDRQQTELLKVNNLCLSGVNAGIALQNISFTVSSGEILGIAGVDGSGQKELIRCLVGIQNLHSGSILFDGREIQNDSVGKRIRDGIAYIPEDRQSAGLVMDFSIAENYLLGHETDKSGGGGYLINRQMLTRRVQDMISTYDVRVGTDMERTPARSLSGGNQQKIVIGRALDYNARFLIACQPTRGLDIGATQSVYKSLYKARDSGFGIILFSLDIDEIMEISDRIGVLFNGRLLKILDRHEATLDSIGSLMTGNIS